MTFKTKKVLQLNVNIFFVFGVIRTYSVVGESITRDHQKNCPWLRIFNTICSWNIYRLYVSCLFYKIKCSISRVNHVLAHSSPSGTISELAPPRAPLPAPFLIYCQEISRLLLAIITHFITWEKTVKSSSP